MPEVAIFLGSDSDLPKVKACFNIFNEFGVSFETSISSAHRTPEKIKEQIETAKDRGIKVIIAVAGGAAHLPGVIASHTTLPVIGVPIETQIAGGIDSILSILQMPSGIPVATMPSGQAGGANAALYAICILALCNKEYDSKLIEYRRKMKEKIFEKNNRLKSIGPLEYIKELEEKK